MQVKASALTPDGTSIEIPPQYWEELAGMEIDAICRRAGQGVRHSRDNSIHIPLFHTHVDVDLEQKYVICHDEALQHSLDKGLLELLLLVYLQNAADVPLGGESIGVKELKSAHFFQGPHTLMSDPLIERFGGQPERLIASGKRLGGEALELADAAIKLWPLPRIPLTYLLWAGDEEFSAQLSFLFDPSIERHLAADGIWGLVNMTSNCLLAVP